jgi:hypothetical protein
MTIGQNIKQTIRPGALCATEGRQPLSAGSSFIRIVGVPPGEAPLWVRERWVGLQLPLADGDRGPRQVLTSGVLSGPRNRLIALWWRLRGRLPRKSGYAVDAIAAVGILERTAPEAAAWWRQNVPRLQRRGRKFLFAPSACEIVNEAA